MASNTKLETDGFAGLTFDMKPEYFVAPEARFLWECLTEMKDKEIVPTMVNLADYIRSQIGPSADVNQIALVVISLCEDCANTTNINYWAKKMVEQFCHRKIAELAAQNIPDAGERILNLRESLETLNRTDGLGGAKFKMIGEILVEVIEQIEKEMTDPDSVLTVPTFWTEHDKKLIFGKGNLIIIGGRSGMGKTSYAINLIKNMIMNDLKVAMFSLEMTQMDVTKILLALHGKITHRNLVHPTGLSDDECDRLVQSADMLHLKKLTILDEPRVTCSEIYRQALQIKRKLGGLDAIFIDHLHIMGADKNFSDIRMKMIYISSELKNMSKDLRLPIIALAQNNRECDKRPDHKPIVSDLKESGSLEQDADMILFTYRPNYYDDKSEDDKTYIICKKNRHGEMSNFDIPMNFDTRTKTFTEGSRFSV
jgi:replicative DNA helicase